MTARDDFKTVSEVPQPSIASGRSEPPGEIHRGTVIGRYTVLERLGAGAFATVFSAYDATLERVVALKVLRGHLDNAETRARMLREAKSLTRVKHPHVATVYDVGTFGDRIFLTTEFVEGPTLRRWLSQRPPWREVLDVLKAAGRGLGAIHDVGLVHRDFQPDNVVIGKDGRVLVTDFGIARREQPAPRPLETSAGKSDSSDFVTNPRVTVPAPRQDADDDEATMARRVNLVALREATVQEGDAAASSRPDEPGLKGDDDDEATMARRVDFAALKNEGSSAQDEMSSTKSDDDEATVARKVDITALKREAALTGGAPSPSIPSPSLSIPSPSFSIAPSPSRPPSDERAVSGTPGYLAPEHLFSSDDNARSDQFSFAVTMYTALYGKQPFRSRNMSTYCEAVQKAPEAPPDSSVPAWIHVIIERGLKRQPEQRFASMTELLDALGRETPRRQRSWAIGAGVVAACIAGLVGYRSHGADLQRRCDEGTTIVASTWNREIAQRTHIALARAGGQHGAATAERVTSRLSAYAVSWAAAYRTVAEATLLLGVQDPATMDRRLGCLERGRDHFAALTEILLHPDAAVSGHAVDAAFALPAPEACATSDVNSIPASPASPDLRARVRSAERTVAEAVAHDRLGQSRLAEEIVARALPEIRNIPHPRAEAELLLVDADCKQDRGDSRGALESSEAAFHAAERASDDVQATLAAARIAYLSSSSLDKPQEGERWMKIAEAIAERAGHNDALKAALLASRIPVNAMLDHPELNLELHDKEVALLEHLYTPRDPRVARAVINRGITKYLLGKFEPALVDIQAGITLLKAVAGPGNRHLVLDYTNLGAVLIALGRLSEAKDAYEHVLALEADGPPSTLAVKTYGAVADIENEIGSPDRAVEIAERGLDAARAAGEKGMLEWMLRLAIAGAKGKNNDFAGEAQDCRAVLAAQKAAGALAHDAPYAPDALTCLGEAELDLHHTDAALVLLEESVTYQVRIDQSDLARARFALAQALRIAGRAPERAKELAESARDDFRKLPKLAKQLTAVEEWLAEPTTADPATPVSPSTQAPASSGASRAVASSPPENTVPVASTPSEGAAPER